MLERQLALLERVAEAGVQIVVALERQAQGLAQGEAEAPVVTTGDVALAYGRAARAVRAAIALQTRLAQDFLAYGQEAARAASQADFSAQGARARRKADLGRIVRRAVHDATDGEGPHRELVETAAALLADDTLYGGMMDRPYSELLAAICGDLGIALDWSVLAEEGWVQAELACGRPGAPLQALMADGGQDADAAADRPDAAVPCGPCLILPFATAPPPVVLTG